MLEAGWVDQPQPEPPEQPEPSPPQRDHPFPCWEHSLDLLELAGRLLGQWAGRQVGRLRRYPRTFWQEAQAAALRQQQIQTSQAGHKPARDF
jgi:hypothetical protein